MIITVTHTKISPESLVNDYQAAVQKVRAKFVSTLDAYSRRYVNEHDWWLSSPASKNTFISPLFHYTCALVTIQTLLEKEIQITEVHTDSPAFKQVLETVLKRKLISLPVKLTQSRLRLCKIRFLGLKSIFGQLRLHLKQWKACQKLNPPKPDKSQRLIVLDHFITNHSKTIDHHYPSLWEKLPEEERPRVYYLPTLTGIKDFSTCYRELLETGRNFLFIHQWLKPSDLLLTAWKAFASGFRCVPAFGFGEFDLAPLIREELRNFNLMNNTFLGWINLLFVHRLRQQGVPLERVIDWFENHAGDRGLALGVRRNYPDSDMVGYVGVPLRQSYLLLYPTPAEAQAGVLPKRFVIMGPSWIQSMLEFLPDYPIDTAPAFRFRKLLDGPPETTRDETHRILVPLPLDWNLIRGILERIAKAHTRVKAASWWIKAHPLIRPEDIKQAFPGQWPENFTLIEGEFVSWLSQADLLISTDSSTCLEAVSWGVPVIIIGGAGLTYNPLPPDAPKELWRMVYLQQDFDQALTSILQPPGGKIGLTKAQCQELLHHFFYPVNQKTVREFLGLAENAKEKEEKTVTELKT